MTAAVIVADTFGDGIDIMMIRELVGGIYFGKKTEGDAEATDICTYSREEIERVVVQAAELARQRCGGLTMVDKANVLATSPSTRCGP